MEDTDMLGIKGLWQDSRSYGQRLLPAALVSLGFAFTFFFFGPVETIAGSQDSVSFTLADITPIMGVFALLAAVCMGVVLPLLRGRIFSYTLSLLFAVSIGCYVQGNFLNSGMAAMTGDAVLWQLYKGKMLISTAVWLFLIIGVFFLLYINRRVWKGTLIFVSAAVVLMQAAGFVSLLVGGSFAYEKPLFLSKDGIDRYSSSKNVLVYVLDRLDYEYMENVLAEDPAFFEPLDGFTSYTNAISELARTMPALTYMFTNDESMYTKEKRDYFESAWVGKEGSLLRDISGSGMSMRFYTELDSVFGRGQTVRPYVANMQSGGGALKPIQVIKNLLTVSCYRSMPYAFKPFFWYSTDDVSRGVRASGSSYAVDETEYLSLVNGFALDDDKGQFKLLHFNGPHAPYTLNEKGEIDPENATLVTQTKGSFYILFEAFAKMKELGIYEDTSILILGDHGYSEDLEPLKRATRIGMLYKPAGASDTPLQESKAPVSFKNIPATLVRDAGLSYESYGTPLDLVSEDAAVTRRYQKTIMGQLHEEELLTYDVTGDAADFNNWKLRDTRKIEHPFF